MSERDEVLTKSVYVAGVSAAFPTLLLLFQKYLKFTSWAFTINTKYGYVCMKICTQSQSNASVLNTDIKTSLVHGIIFSQSWMYLSVVSVGRSEGATNVKI